MHGAFIISIDTNTRKNGYHPTTEVEGISSLKRLVITLQEQNLSPIIVLTKEKAAIENHLAKMGVLCLGPDFQDTPAKDYFLEAVSLLSVSCDSVFLTTTDYPLFHSDTLQRLSLEKKLPVLPVFENQSGFPILLTSKSLQNIYDQGKHGTVDSLFNEITKNAATIPVTDSGVIANLGFLSEWKEYLKAHKINTLRPISKLMIAREHVFLGPGTYQLLLAIKRCHSVRNACTLTGISYSKGWRMIKLLEEQSRIQVVKRHKGGEKGGSTTLTPKGELLIETYQSYVKSCNAAIHQLFEEHFSKLQEDLNNDD
ncbi:molybdenum cofactor cytidylyltransferase [Aequitasia blattaphilus]|uniref:LysR family transcriptional regulator n=1 Tax=Aequitasia blattaphilus TaxID=2949332 RepID=A0ABT1E8C8_9FIRM|nr:LysR family transcriptional regulator [Aequitasia blattaphilus]MCP1102091.1 LysR family transcriptional regulator [Aequitasia blattaphilus]MCR8614731.1 LysR family transcriptional regulator [Aequitasia blattaphilus]